MGTLRTIFKALALVPGFMPEEKRQRMERDLLRRRVKKARDEEWMRKREEYFRRTGKDKDK